MSQDLFAAFGDPPPETPISQAPYESNQESTHVFHGASEHTQNAAHSSSDIGQLACTRPDADIDEGDDDWGDFEDASAKPAAIEESSSSYTAKSPQQTAKSPQSTAKKNEAPAQQDSKIGKHPFAEHMDFLFDPGDDEYDAGEDDLANLAKDPAAAMAFSKRLIAEQEAKAKSVAPAPRNGIQSSRSTGSYQPTAELEKQRRRLSKPSPRPVSPKKAAAPPPANPPPARNKLRKKSGYAPAKDPDVLFDADNLSEADDDDEFGDFENGTQPVVAVVEPPTPVVEQAPSVMPSMDLLGLDDNLKPVVQIGRSRSDSLRKANEILGPTKKPGHSRSSSLIDDTAWDDFEPQTSAAVVPPAAIASMQAADDDAWDDFEAAEPVATAPPLKNSQAARISLPSTHSRTASQTTVPPTNIPPPAIILSVFPSIFSAAQDALFLPLSRLDQTQRQQLLAHPATQQFLRSYLDTAIVLARIIAGRKQRWKRDQILSQSMRIGQAGAGGKSGMKLTGVDKGEAKKEEQEAQEALRLWRAQAGKLRGAVTTASSTNATKIPPIPEISEQIPIRTLKAIEGGFTAPHACALCGLRREERVAKVDIDVDDSFGEWWVQGVDMHLACRNWWDEHNAKLKSR